MLCVSTEVEQTARSCYNNTFCLVYGSREVEQPVGCLCNDLLLGVCWCRAFFQSQKVRFNSETPILQWKCTLRNAGDSKSVGLHWGDVLGRRHSLMLVQ